MRNARILHFAFPIFDAAFRISHFAFPFLILHFAFRTPHSAFRIFPFYSSGTGNVRPVPLIPHSRKVLRVIPFTKL